MRDIFERLQNLNEHQRCVHMALHFDDETWCITDVCATEDEPIETREWRGDTPHKAILNAECYLAENFVEWKPLSGTTIPKMQESSDSPNREAISPSKDLQLDVSAEEARAWSRIHEHHASVLGFIEYLEQFGIGLDFEYAKEGTPLGLTKLVDMYFEVDRAQLEKERRELLEKQKDALEMLE